MADSGAGASSFSISTSQWYWVGPVLVYSLAVLALFHDTAFSIVSIWSRSDTYAHGYLIVPISIWLVWTRRSVLATLTIRPNHRVLLLLIPAGFIWLLASLVDVLVVSQLALVCVLVTGIWSIVGNALAKALAFPLGFLFLAVPMGEDLVPPMMELTATSTVWLIQLTGIPVYREGLYFTLPSGNWSVVEACSGVRYLIASFTLGLLYAYLTYRSLNRRLLFVLASIIVPIIANILRAYMIVMLGHLSDMKLATGVDHLIYGWVFFGLVMLFMFWAGSFWQQDAAADINYRSVDRAPPAAPGSPSVKPLLGTALAVLAAAVWPLLGVAIDSVPQQKGSHELVEPIAHQPWTFAEREDWDWGPVNPGADREIVQFYKNGEHTVALYLQQYLEQDQGVELVSGSARLVMKDTPWRLVARGTSKISLGDTQVNVSRSHLASAVDNLEVWSLYRIGDRYTANRYFAKLLEAINKITFGRRDAARIVLATSATGDESKHLVLQSFLDANLQGIEMSLDDVALEGMAR